MDLRDFAKKSDENSENHKKRLDKKVLFIMVFINFHFFYDFFIYKKFVGVDFMGRNLCYLSQTIIIQ